MKKYSVKEVSKLSGVSVRTLHYYDKIDLLTPLNRTEAGYRYYGETELLRLQQVLFYKELDFSLNEISDLLDNPDFDLVKALEGHKTALAKRQKRISHLLTTIDQTIKHVKEKRVMTNPEELYEGMPKEFGTTYRDEAINEYGKETIEQSEKELVKLGKDGFKKLQVELEDVSGELFKLRSEDPKSIKVQQLIGLHYKVIRKFWGTAHKKDKQAEAYAGLGQLYVSDERFTLVKGEPQPAYAQFLQKAMTHFSETALK